MVTKEHLISGICSPATSEDTHRDEEDYATGTSRSPYGNQIDQAVEYCKKEGDYEEFGEKPKSVKEKGEGEKKRWRRIYEKACERMKSGLRKTAQCRVQAHGYLPQSQEG